MITFNNRKRVKWEQNYDNNKRCRTRCKACKIRVDRRRKRAEKELYTKQLGDVLKYVDQMNEVDTSNVKPMTQVIDFVNVMREDKVSYEISKEDLMANGPEVENGFFKVPKIN